MPLPQAQCRHAAEKAAPNDRGVALRAHAPSPHGSTAGVPHRRGEVYNEGQGQRQEQLSGAACKHKAHPTPTRAKEPGVPRACRGPPCRITSRDPGAPRELRPDGRPAAGCPPALASGRRWRGRPGTPGHRPARPGRNPPRTPGDFARFNHEKPSASGRSDISR